MSTPNSSRASFSLKESGYGAVLRQSIIWIILVVLVLASTILSRGVFFTAENLLHLLRQVSMIAIVTTGQIFVMLTGGFDLSVGSVVALSSCIAVMAVNASYSGVAVFFLPVLVGAAIGLMNGFMVNAIGLIPFVATLAMLIMARGFAFVLTGGSPQYMLPEAIEKFGIYGRGSIGIVPVPVLIMGVVFCIGYYILHRTTLGQHIYAIGNNEETSRLAGIRVARTKYVVYGLCGMFAGFAGLIFASRVSYGYPAVAASYNFDSIIPIVMGGASLSGGKGSLTNAIVCVIIMGILASVMNMLNVSPFIQDGARGLILLFAVYFLSEKKKW